MNIGFAQGPKVGPSDRVQQLSVKPSVLGNNHRGVAFQNLEKDDHMWLTDIRGVFIDHELFVPLTCVMAFDAHVEKLGTHREQKVYILVCHIAIRVN